EKVLKSFKSPRLQPLKKAQELLEKKQFAAARSAVARLTAPVADELFGDAALMLTSLSWRREAEVALEKGRFQQALMAAEKAKAPLFQISPSFPYSPLADEVAEGVAEADLIIAEVHFVKM